MLRNFKLATRFTLLLSLVFIGTTIISGITLSNALEHRAEQEINDRGKIVLQMVNSVRDYTENNISPLLAPGLETQEKFIPETVPTFSAKKVFDYLSQHPEYKNFIYKDATINPTSRRDKADEFEAAIIERFRQEPEKDNLSGFRTLYGDKLFYSARPFAITQQSCLRCHSTPEKAPKSLITTYGAENGFGWKLNEIIGTQIIYVPANKVFDNAHKTFSLVLAIFLIIFTTVIFCINLLLKQNVIQPIKPLADLAQRMTTDSINSEVGVEAELQQIEIITKRTDELGQLGKVFQRMIREIHIREQKLKQQVQELKIEIDHGKRAHQVSEIEASEYFKKLQQEAKDIRKQWKQ
jgi:methyl-accepting chemotaxis protein